MPDAALPAVRVDVLGLPMTGLAGTRNMMRQDKTVTRLALGNLCCHSGRHGAVTETGVVGGEAIRLISKL